MQGIGAPNPFVNNYLLAAAVVPAEALLGAYGALLLFLFAVAFAIVLAARTLALRAGANDAIAIVAATFALYNPWTYTQLIAGHGAMLVAYAATMALIAESLRTPTRPALAAGALAFTLPQLQFFVPALAIAIWLTLTKRCWLPLATWIVAGAPTFVGVLAAHRSLAAVPVTAAWEQTQSLRPLKALLLSGYFARYADGHDHIGAYAVALIVLVAIAGVVAGRTRLTVAALVCTAIVLLVAMGAYGPLGAFIGALVERVPAAGLYRELYDLIGYVVIGYTILAVAGALRGRALFAAFAAATAALLILWVHHSPTAFWADYRALPQIAIDAQQQTRIALMPPFQPLSYHGSYSGLDPDAYPRANDVSTLNEAVPAWPGDAALARFAILGRTEDLASLSVSEIVTRPWYAMTVREFNEQIAVPLAASAQAPAAGAQYATALHITPVPILSLVRVPPLVSIGDRIGAAARFFGDAGYPRPQLVNAPRTYVHASEGWVDVRLAYAVQPELAQPFGGALTTQSAAPLTLPGGPQLLVNIHGELRSVDGRSLTHTTNGYHWISLPEGVRAVTCLGECAIALQGSVPAGFAENARLPSATPLDFQQRAPFLVQATLPPGPRLALRYNVRFDEQWICAGCPVGTIHTALDETVNGWLLPSRSAPLAIHLIEPVALVQAFVQAISLAWIIAVLGFAIREVRASTQRPAV